MEPFTVVNSPAAVLADDNIDTDIIFPARFLLITAKKGLGRYAFYEKRYADGAERPEFPLNHEPARSAKILIAGENFGCGSSREQAVWALHDLGFRAVIAPSFGEIFRSNCFKSGVLPITLPATVVTDLQRAAQAGHTVRIDLTTQKLGVGGADDIGFEVEDWRREALLNGWDDVLILLNQQVPAITAFETAQRAEAPWLYPNP